MIKREKKSIRNIYIYMYIYLDHDRYGQMSVISCHEVLDLKSVLVILFIFFKNTYRWKNIYKNIYNII